MLKLLLLLSAFASAGLHESFYDASVPTPALLAQLKEAGAKSPKEMRSALRASARTQPSRLFAVQGKLSSFDYSPPAMPGAVYTILYYIPPYVALGPKAKPAPAIVFLHGGGASTTTPEGAKGAALMYSEDLLPIADRLGAILVLPCSSVGWNLHTRGVLRELTALMRAELPVDPDRVVLAGHSMGGMGISREAPYLTDQFSGFLALSAGTPPGYGTEPQLLTYFNVRYNAVNGRGDHFSDFDPRMKVVAADIKRLEERLGRPSGFVYGLTQGDHQYDPRLMEGRLTDLLSTPRQNAQRRLYPLFYSLDYTGAPPYRAMSLESYFWVEAGGTPRPGAKQKMGAFEVAAAKGNKITVKTVDNAFGARRLRLYLDSSLADLSRPVKVTVDGKAAFSGKAKTDPAALLAEARRRRDHTLLFEGWVDVPLTR